LDCYLSIIMTNIIMEVYDAFKAGGTPDAEARAAAAVISERINGVKGHVENVAANAKSSAKEDLKDLATVMREGFERMDRHQAETRKEFSSLGTKVEVLVWITGIITLVVVVPTLKHFLGL
jgi:BMFP domain-containing protein YqiC